MSSSNALRTVSPPKPESNTPRWGDESLLDRTCWVSTVSVYTILVKNITLSAEESLIERARAVAQSEQTTLNAAFRDGWSNMLRARGAAQHFVP